MSQSKYCVALALVFVAVLVTSWNSIVSVSGSWVIPVAVVALAAQMVLGYLIGFDRSSRHALSLVTGVRATSPALAIAKTTFGTSPTVIATVMVVAVIAFLPMVVSLHWGRRVP